MNTNDNDDVKKYINEIKNDISSIKHEINTLSEKFEEHIKDHSSTYLENKDSIKNDLLKNNIYTDNDLDGSVQLSNDSVVEEQDELEIEKSSLIDYLFIENSSNNQSLINTIRSSNKNISACYKRNFLTFCRCAISLIEEVIKIFLEKKFFDIENDNDKLLQACDILELEYLENKPNKLKFPHIYISKQEYNRYKRNPNDYYYYSKRELYLSLKILKGSDIIFTLELCFVILYGKSFYNKSYVKPHNVNLQTPSKAIKRPIAKLASSIEPLNKQFYYCIDNVRKLRNTIVHNENNKEEQEKQFQEQLSKDQYLRNLENNYDGIIEAITWLIRQIYFAMMK